MTLNEIILVIAVLLIAGLSIFFLINVKLHDLRLLEETQYNDDLANCYTYKGFIWALGKSKVKNSVVSMEIMFGDGTSATDFSEELGLFSKRVVKAINEELGACIIGHYDINYFLIAIPSVDSSFVLSKMETLRNRIDDLNLTFIKLSTIYGVCGEEGTPQKQVEKANFALKYAKRKNTNAVYYDERVFKMQNNFNRILNNPNLIGDEFGVFYQPIIKARTGELVGAEAKVRWLGENGQILYFPKEFVDEFTSNGFITQIDLYVFETVCSFIESLEKRSIKPVTIAVNIAGIDLLNPFFIDNVKKILGKYKFDIKRMHFLVSNLGLFDNQNVINDSINSIKELGITIESNDFGNEFVNEQLVNPTFTIYKFNKSFIKNQLRTVNEQTIIKSYIEMIEKLGKVGIVKNIETASVAEYAKKCGKNVLLQGNYLFQCIPVNNFETLLQDNRHVIDNIFEVKETPIEEVKEEKPVVVEPVQEERKVAVEEVKVEPVQEKKELVVEEVKVEEVKEEKPSIEVEEVKKSPKKNEDDEEDEYEGEDEEDDNAADNDAEEEKIAKLMEIYKKQFQDQWEQEMLRKYPELMKKHYARRKFYERVINLSPDNKKYYNMIKNKIMSYSDITNATTNYFDTFINKRRIFFKIAIVGKSIKIYLALNPNNYPTGQFPHKDASDIKRHEKTPFVMKVSSNLAIRRANILIDDLARLNQITPRADYKEKDYVKSMQAQVRNKGN